MTAAMLPDISTRISKNAKIIKNFSNQKPPFSIQFQNTRMNSKFKNYSSNYISFLLFEFDEFLSSRRNFYLSGMSVTL